MHRRRPETMFRKWAASATDQPGSPPAAASGMNNRPAGRPAFMADRQRHPAIWGRQILHSKRTPSARCRTSGGGATRRGLEPTRRSRTKPLPLLVPPRAIRPRSFTPERAVTSPNCCPVGDFAAFCGQLGAFDHQSCLVVPGGDNARRSKSAGQATVSYGRWNVNTGRADRRFAGAGDSRSGEPTPTPYRLW